MNEVLLSFDRHEDLVAEFFRDGIEGLDQFHPERYRIWGFWVAATGNKVVYPSGCFFQARALFLQSCHVFSMWCEVIDSHEKESSSK
jgi:hypothetical protein